FRTSRCAFTILADHGAIRIFVARWRKDFRRCARNGFAAAETWKITPDESYCRSMMDTFPRCMLRMRKANAQRRPTSNSNGNDSDLNDRLASSFVVHHSSFAARKPLRAKPGNCVTQLYYA